MRFIYELALHITESTRVIVPPTLKLRLKHTKNVESHSSSYPVQGYGGCWSLSQQPESEVTRHTYR